MLTAQPTTSHLLSITMEPLTFLACLSSLLLLALSWSWFIRDRKAPPGPFSWPLLGSLLSLRQPLHVYFKSLENKYGSSLIYLKIGMNPFLIVNDADMAREVFKTYDAEFAFRPDTRSFRLFSLGYKDLLFAPYGDLWKKLRRVSLVHMFSPAKLNASAAIRHAEIRFIVSQLRVQIEKGEAVELRDFVAEYNTNVICLMLFGEKLDEAKRVVELVEKIANLGLYINVGELFPLLDPLDLHGIYKTMRKEILPEIKSILEGMINRRKELLASGNAGDEQLIDILLSLEEEDALSEDSIMALLMDMVTAGLESSQGVSEYAIAECIQHPEVIQRAQQELDSVVGKSRLVKEEDLPSLPYIQGIVKETLRLHPPGPLGIPHTNPKPVTIGEYTVPPNCTVLTNMWAIGRDPKQWKEPEKFMPERFIESDVSVAGTHFQYIPFSAGRRICAGYPLAMRSIPLVVGTLLHAFEWSSLPGSTLDGVQNRMSSKLASKLTTHGILRLHESAY